MLSLNGQTKEFSSKIKFEGEELVLEPFSRLIADDQLMAYRHSSFWRSMDTLRDRQTLEDLVEQGEMPWRKSGDLSMKRATVVV